MYDSLHRADKNGKFSLRLITSVGHYAYDLTGKNNKTIAYVSLLRRVYNAD